MAWEKRTDVGVDGQTLTNPLHSSSAAAGGREMYGVGQRRVEEGGGARTYM